MMRIEKSVFGKTGSGVEIEQYEFFAGDIKARVMTFGSVLIGIDVPDKTGKYHDVTLGYDSLDDYINDKFYFGAIIGRYAGRIRRGHFRLNEKDYFLTRNNGSNHLHGGNSGFSKNVWHAEPFSSADKIGVKLNYQSKSGEEGYPGDLSCQIIYTLSSDNSLSIKYIAKCTEPTPVNLANHSYFNLSEQGNILQHSLKLYADKYLPADDELLPTGEILSVKGTSFDFSSERVLKHAIKETENGFDNTFVINNGSGRLKLAAVLKSPDTGIVMEVLTTKPGIHLYTGNFLDSTVIGKNGKALSKFGGLCLEDQHFPDSPNIEHFPSTILLPGEVYMHETVYKFYREN